MGVWELLERLGTDVRDSIAAEVVVDERDDVPGPGDMALESPRWIRVDDVVAVVADLKGSTAFNSGRQQRTIARFYEAYMAQLVRAADSQGPSFIDIQGDGLFALFSGPRRYERALVTGVTMKTFAKQKLLPALGGMTDLPDTGLKVGMAVGAILVKRVGIRGTNEPVWAGKPVNWAAKAAQAADADELIALPTLYQQLRENDFIRYSCGCGGSPRDLWKPRIVDRLPEDQRECHALETTWCVNCGDAFSEAILQGERHRDGMPR